jgi:hypothetical protein
MVLLVLLHVFINADVVRRLPFKVRSSQVLGEEVACIRFASPKMNELYILHGSSVVGVAGDSLVCISVLWNRNSSISSRNNGAVLAMVMITFLCENQPWRSVLCSNDQRIIVLWSRDSDLLAGGTKRGE